MSGIVTPTDVELALAWQASIFFSSNCPSGLPGFPTTTTRGSLGSWQELYVPLLTARKSPGDDARLVDLFRLAQWLYERLWREGRAFQPGWWRDVIIPQLAPIR